MTPPPKPLSTPALPTPAFRRLRGFAFDPGLSTRISTLPISETIFKIRWEELERGPRGEYLEVVDYDPASKCFYAPVDLNHPSVLAQDGLPPSAKDPRFHQQMVYAVAMLTIDSFERALGRPVQWSSGPGEHPMGESYVQRLRIYPHALRQANAYYSPSKKALLFGYFRADPESPVVGTVFTCLSHDIVAHETTHAILDGMHRLFLRPTNPDSLAFHEAFADIVALFQHFTIPEVLRHQVGQTRGDLGDANLLGALAQQLGLALGHRGALRDALGYVSPVTGQWERSVPDPADYQTVIEPHARGAILVAAVFDAFVTIYRSRTADLLRIATGGTGRLPAGDIHPDLVNRLAEEAAKASRHVLTMCIRALDYCPPVDINFGDYLRALITADYEMLREDERGYRVAFMEAFLRRGIYPDNVRAFSEDGLRWERSVADVECDLRPLFKALRPMVESAGATQSRRELYHQSREFRMRLHHLISTSSNRGGRGRFNGEAFWRLAGLEQSMNFEVHSVAPSRAAPHGQVVKDVIVTLIQKLVVEIDPDRLELGSLPVYGGCTLVLDFERETLRYAITKRVSSEYRMHLQRQYWATGRVPSLRATYFGDFGYTREPFAFLHAPF